MTLNWHRQIVSEAYRSPVMFAFVLQILIALLCLLMLDGGQLARICGIAMAGFWAGVLLAMIRRPFAPTFTDLAAIRLGFLGIFVPLLFLLGQLG